MQGGASMHPSGQIWEKKREREREKAKRLEDQEIRGKLSCRWVKKSFLRGVV
jgi:hypothetical protein